MTQNRAFPAITLPLLLAAIATYCWAIPARSKPAAKKVSPAAAKRQTAGTKKTASASKAKTSTAKRTTAVRRRRPVRSIWTEPSFADSTSGDVIEGEDLVVRRAAVEALGPYNGTVVVVDPYTGRILTIVNQKLALKSGFQPCSTIKIVAALAALSEGIIDRNTRIRVSRRQSMDLTEALAVSNNPYFATLGHNLGFERVCYYARLLGLGEKAGLDVEGEQPGLLPSSPPPGGMGMMTSFGEGILLTPLELAALLSVVANGGTLHYLQYPRSEKEAAEFVPRVKRHLALQPWIEEIKPGMMGATLFGTAQRASYSLAEPVLGKTGTCTDRRTGTIHLGWFGSFNEVGRNKLVVVVLLTGGRQVNGPTASEIAGAVYRNLSVQQFFATARPYSPTALVTTQSCCTP